MIIITMTTCKRFALFVLTVQSFLRYCQDCSGQWLVVDDGSEEREQMQAILPNNATFIWKEEKGHDKSMNVIREQTRGFRYVLHLEDDWEFIAPFSIRELLAVLDDDPRIGQVLVNENYAESPEDAATRVITGYEDRGDYLVHVYDPGFTRRRAGTWSHGHWPHFSLRPGLWRREILEIGEFAEGHSEFEKEYGTRYMQAGYVTAFLKGVRAIHRGKDKSAYPLNHVNRF